MDEKADPARLAEVGLAVRERLRNNPRTVPRAGRSTDLFTVPGFADDETCRILAEAVERQATPSPLFNDDPTGRKGIRTSATHYFHGDSLASHVAARIDALLGLDRAHAEPLQGQRYRPGEEYRQHRDSFLLDRQHWQRERERGGQRTWTAMLYLNEPEAGGGTRFPRLGLTIVPETGMLVCWNNMNRRGRPDPTLLHAGLPVEAGCKYVITQWYRLDPWRAYAGPGGV